MKMIDDMQLVQLLKNGRVHSGEKLAGVLGVSRTAVWKRINKLIDKGVKIKVVKGKGYHLEEPLSLLSENSIFSLLEPSVAKQLSLVHVLGEADSTNRQASLAANARDCHAQLWLSEMQRDGRGRRGKPWYSPFAKNIYMSLVWGVHGGIQMLEGLSLAVGVVVAETLASLGLCDVQLKWPNDVLVDGKKIAGILLDVAGDPSDYCQVVIGIGVNVNLSHIRWVGMATKLGGCEQVCSNITKRLDTSDVPRQSSRPHCV